MTHPMLGMLLQQATHAHQAKAFDQAESLYRAALQLDARNFDALHLLGVLLSDTGRIQEGIGAIERALALHPNAAAHSNLASLYRLTGRLDDAASSYDRALALSPCMPEALNGLGVLRLQQDRVDEALRHFEEALLVHPNFPEAQNNRGNALLRLHRTAHAIQAYQEAIRLSPAYAQAHNNLGFALVQLRECDAALQHYERAIALMPDYARAKLNSALCLLLQGHYAAAWPRYEYRWADQQRGSLRQFEQPRWSGGLSLQGKTLLLHAEQGLGDAIQFCRFAPLAAALGAQVVLEAPASLTEVFQTLGDGIKVISSGDPLPDFDLHCPLASLPLAFAAAPDTLPSKTYLSAAKKDIEHWQQHLPPGSGSFRIGIVWAGSQTDPSRAIPLETLLSALPREAQIISLQKEISTDSAATLVTHPEIVCCEDALNSFADTAAVLANLDLIITIDTSVAHLAGAMGLPVWVLLHTASDWRWMAAGPTTPWYPSARLFRQHTAGDWGSLVTEALQPALQAFCTESPADR
jgi:tetratricopeptide (TPR) repeat protein